MKERRITNRKKAITIVCIVLYIAFATWSIIEHQAYRSAFFEYYRKWFPNPERFVSPQPYLQFWYGQVVVLGFAVIIIATSYLIFSTHKPTPKNVLTALMALILLGSLVFLQTSSFSVQPVKASPEPIYVNTLLYFDEECTDAQMREWWWQKFFEYDSTSTWRPATRFKDFFDITFLSLNGQNQFWDSNDAETNSYYLLQEGIQELGGVYNQTNDCWVWQQKDYQKGTIYYLADFLILITDQDIDIWGGLSPEAWNAMILRFDRVRDDYITIHELSHQFNVPHCPNFCVMNDEISDIMWNWCSSCSSLLNNNRENWGYKEWVGVNSRPEGHTDPQNGYTYQVIRDSNFVVLAIPNPGYSFGRFAVSVDNHGSYYYTNPITITVTQPTLGDLYHWWVRAEYKTADSDPAPSPQGGVGGGIHYIK